MQDKAMLMTEGKPSRVIMRFAAPVFLGQLFQLFYNLVDSLVVGNYLDENALAAVVSGGNLIFIFVGFFTGTFAGISVVVARHYGSQDNTRLSRCVHTTMAFSMIMGVIMSLLGVALSPALLRLISTPESVYPHSLMYFRVYFMGSFFTVVYNAASGILQAVGDTKTPLYLLILSSIINVLLDFLMVGVFHMGVDGAALATVIAQCVCCFMIIAKLIRVRTPYRLRLRGLRIDRLELKMILRVGIPTGLQNSVISIANVVVQYAINRYGEIVVAGSGLYSKVSDSVFLPITSLSIAVSTFIGQNIGAGKKARAAAGARFSLLAGMAFTEALGIMLMLFSDTVFSLFTDNTEVIAYGTLQVRTIAPFYFLLAFAHITAGIMRGAGHAAVPMIIMGIVWCVLRILYILLIAVPSGSIQALYWAYPLTWAVSDVAFFIFCSRLILRSFSAR